MSAKGASSAMASRTAARASGSDLAVGGAADEDERGGVDGGALFDGSAVVFDLRGARGGCGCGEEASAAEAGDFELRVAELLDGGVREAARRACRARCRCGRCRGGRSLRWLRGGTSCLMVFWLRLRRERSFMLPASLRNVGHAGDGEFGVAEEAWRRRRA